MFTEGVVLWLSTGNNMNETSFLLHDFCELYHMCSFVHQCWAYFLQDDTTSELVKLVSHVTDTNSVTQSDDGTTQTVTAKTGILTASQVAIPNPVQLAPLCTFSDAEQPMRRFVFRLKGGEDGVSAALFEADGNAWKNAAIRNIKAYFEREIPQELRDDVIILA